MASRLDDLYAGVGAGVDDEASGVGGDESDEGGEGEESLGGVE